MSAKPPSQKTQPMKGDDNTMVQISARGMDNLLLAQRQALEEQIEAAQKAHPDKELFDIVSYQYYETIHPGIKADPKSLGWFEFELKMQYYVHFPSLKTMKDLAHKRAVLEAQSDG